MALYLTPTATKTGSYTAAGGDLVICDASGGAFNVSLPAATGTGNPVAVVKKDTSGTAVGIIRAGSDTINGLASGGQTSISVRGEGDIYWLVDVATATWQVVDCVISPSYCDVYTAAQQTGVVTSTHTAVAMDSENSDPDNLHSTSSSNSRITIKKAGEYDITGTVCTAGVAAAFTWDLFLWKNGVGTGTILSSVYLPYPANSAAGIMNIAVQAVLAAADYIELGVFQDSGSNKSLLNSSGRTNFQANRIGG